MRVASKENTSEHSFLQKTEADTLYHTAIRVSDKHNRRR